MFAFKTELHLQANFSSMHMYENHSRWHEQGWKKSHMANQTRGENKGKEKERAGVATLPLYIKTSSQMISCPTLLYSVN